MNESKKEELIETLTRGLDESVDKMFITGVTIPDTAELSLKKRYLKYRSLIWFEQEKQEGKIPAYNNNFMYWLSDKIDEGFQDENQDEIKIAYSTLCQMLDPKNVNVKINKQIEDFVLSRAPKVSDSLIAKALYFSNVLNYLLHSKEKCPYDYFGKENYLQVNENNIKILRSFSCEEIEIAMNYVSALEEHESWKSQEIEDNMRDEIKKELKNWLNEKVFEEVQLIHDYWDKWLLFDEIDFKIWIALFDEDNKIQVEKLMKNRKISVTTVRNKLGTYNELMKIDWSSILKCIEDMKKWDDDTFEKSKSNLIDDTVDFLLMPRRCVIKDILNDYLEEVIKDIQEPNGFEKIVETWNLFLDVYLFLTNKEGKMEKEILNILSIDEKN